MLCFYFYSSQSFLSCILYTEDCPPNASVVLFIYTYVHISSFHIVFNDQLLEEDKWNPLNVISIPNL